MASGWRMCTSILLARQMWKANSNFSAIALAQFLLTLQNSIGLFDLVGGLDSACACEAMSFQAICSQIKGAGQQDLLTHCRVSQQEHEGLRVECRDFASGALSASSLLKFSNGGEA